MPEAGRPALGLAFPGRVRLLLCLFGLALSAVFVRLIQLEATSGSAYRLAAVQPLTTRETLPAARGRILARDGTVLAFDKPAAALAMHYRYLQLPPDEPWLRRQARSRLPRADRNSPEKVAAVERALRVELESLHARLCQLCRVSEETWSSRRLRITRQVQAMAATVNQRRQQKFARQTAETSERAAGDSWAMRAWHRLEDWLAPRAAGLPPQIVIAEELDYHVLADELPLDAAAAIESRPDLYAHVRVITRTRRSYPHGTLAAHVVGYLGSPGPSSATTNRAGESVQETGKQGIEAFYEHVLAGTPGSERRFSNRSGELVGQELVAPPQPGGDVVLTLDPALQHTAETLLASAIERNRQFSRDARSQQAGGAVLVMDAQRGDILAAASAPTFDPGLFLRGDVAEIDPLLSAPDHPLFCRFTQMALPPGSVFKMVTAAAAIERGVLEPEEHFYCQGFLHHAGGHRCAIFVQRGVGHGEMALDAALAESCNVYFFRTAQRVGPEALTLWARHLGYGGLTGIDLPGEAAANLPDPRAATPQNPWRDGDTLGLAIGQAALTATPLQVATMTAAIANGGRRVTPHVVARVGLAHRLTDDDSEFFPDQEPDSVPIAGLREETLTALRQGLEAAVAHPRGTAYAALGDLPVRVAGKTGTAEAGPNVPSHAWFAGYAPAEKPTVVVVVALEHGGSGGATASLLAARIFDRMTRLGYFK